MGAILRMILFLSLVITTNSSSRYKGIGWNKVAVVPYPPTKSTIYSCNGRIGDCIDQSEEMMLDSEASKNVLALEQKFIVYKFFDKEHVPCSQRGQSYYSCHTFKQRNSRV